MPGALDYQSGFEKKMVKHGSVVEHVAQEPGAAIISFHLEKLTIFRVGCLHFVKSALRIEIVVFGEE